MNYRASAGPVAAEAFPFVLLTASAIFTAFVLGHYYFIFNLVGILLVFALVFIIAFFRNPQRYHKNIPGGIISGADGTVSAAGLMAHPDFEGGQCLRIAVFLSVFDVHVNWAPCAGRVVSSVHYPGKFLNAMSDKSAEENERKIIKMVTPDGQTVIVKLVAGLIARRIVCPIDAEDVLEKGEKIGLIRFGSRCEMLLPAESALHVRPGMSVRGGETLVATMPQLSSINPENNISGTL